MRTGRPLSPSSVISFCPTAVSSVMDGFSCEARAGTGEEESPAGEREEHAWGTDGRALPAALAICSCASR